MKHFKHMDLKSNIFLRLIPYFASVFPRLPQYQSFGSGTTMAAYVAQTKEKLRDSTSNKNPNYPDGVKDAEVCTKFVPGHPRL